MAREVRAILASGSVTQANSRISAVNGTAFWDGSASIITANMIANNDWLEIRDSSGRVIGGFIKAAGTGETFGSELITNGNMELDSEWVDFQLPTINVRSDEQVHGGTYSRKFIPSSGYDGIQSSTAFTVTTGKLYKHVNWVYTTETWVLNYIASISFTGGNHAIAVAVSPNVWTDKTYYFCAGWTSAASYAIYDSYDGTTGTYYIDDVSCKQVLTPSATGVTITTTPGGTTYNWAVKDTNFNYNDSSGYTYRVLARGDRSKLIASYTVTKTHIATVDAGAMFWDEDNDLSAYAGTDAGSTPYYFVFQDSTGKCARAYGGAIGGGEALGAELITAFTNAPGGDAFETFTTSGVDITQAINNAGGWGVGNANAVNVVGNKLYKYTCNFTLNSGTAPIVGFSHVTAGIQSSFSKTMSTGAMTWYVTPNAVYEYFCFQTATTGATDFAALSNSLKEFTDVPVTGLHLMSTRNGTTRNMKDVDSGFNPNGIVKILIYRALP